MRNMSLTALCNLLARTDIAFHGVHSETHARRILRTIILFLCLSNFSSAQSLWYGNFVGGVNYQGELRGRNLTAMGSRLLLGTGITYSTLRGLDIELEYHQGMLSGSDFENPKYLTRRRNLHFETRLQELSLLGSLHLGKNISSPFSVYLSAGISAFRVDPYTYDEQGMKWMLYPLSTEGQGLPQYPDRAPNRNNFLSIPVGGGIELKVSRRIRADLSFLLRKTFTDRIDDVSGAYPDENILLSERGFKAVDLSYRSDELLYESPYFPMEGTMRGNPASKDAYYSLQFRVRYSIGTWQVPLERVRYLFRDDNWSYRF